MCFVSYKLERPLSLLRIGPECHVDGLGHGCARHLRHKWSSIGCKAPNRGEQLSHRRDECHFSGLSPRNQTVIVSSQPRIESYGCQNWHPERLTQTARSRDGSRQFQRIAVCRIGAAAERRQRSWPMLRRCENAQDRLILRSDRLSFAHRHR
jgi:hypothetical protein